MMNNKGIEREAVKRELLNLKRELEEKIKSLESCKVSLNELVNDVTDTVDDGLVETIDFALKTIDLAEKNKNICEAYIDFSENKLNREFRIQGLLGKRRDVLKAEENKLREQFYSGEYDSKLVEDMNNISKKIVKIESIMNDRLENHLKDSVEDDSMRVTLPISGRTIELEKLDKEDICDIMLNIEKLNMDEITKLATQLILSSKSNKEDLYDEFNKIFGDRLQIVKLGSDGPSKVDDETGNDLIRELLSEPLRAMLYSTKHLLNENGNIPDNDIQNELSKSMGIKQVEETTSDDIDDMCRCFMEKFNIDELDHQYGRINSGLSQKILTNWFKDNIQKKQNQEKRMEQEPSCNTRSIGYLDTKKKKQIEEKYSQTPKRFNGYENEIGAYSKDNRNVPMGKLNETGLSKMQITEIEEAIWKKIIEETPKMLAEEMQKVLDKMNK